MSANSATAPRTGKRLPKSTIRTLLFGKGMPRLRLGAILFALLWASLIWLLYPYALSIAAWESNARYLGLALLLVVAIATYKLVRNLGRVIWHLGLLWLGVILLVLFIGVTIVQGRAQDASDWSGWSNAARSVAVQVWRPVTRLSEDLSAVPANIYMAATGSAPFWRPPPAAEAEPVVLSQRANDEQLVLSSEQEPTGITRGVLAMAVSGDGSPIEMRAKPGASAAIVATPDNGTLLVVVGGPQRAGGRIWWQVSDNEHIGWCAAELLTLVSR
jgi:hypothetical protein